LSKEKVPLKIVVPLIVVTWILSLISSLAIVYVMPNLIPVRSEQLGEGLITSDKIANKSVTTPKIDDAAYLHLMKGAVLHNVTYSTVAANTSSTSFVDMPDTSVSITLNRSSTLVIIWSGQAKIEGTGTRALYIRAMVDTAQANPATDTLILTQAEYGSHSYTFSSTKVGPGAHTVKMQWKVFESTTTGRVYERTLTVIALPT